MALEETQDVTEEHEDEGLDDALGRFKKEIVIDAEPMDDQRDAANEDMRFTNVDGGMWEGFLEDEFGARVKLELDQVVDYLNRTYGEWTMNRVGVDYKPIDEKTSDDDADLANGIYRANYRDNSGKLAVDNAVLETLTCGFGAFKLATKFQDLSDPENDKQEIEWRPIHNAYSSVFYDLSAKRIDKADARRCTVLTEFTADAFESVYPDASPVSAYVPDDRRELNNFTSSELGVFVAERYEVIRKRTKVFVYNNLGTGIPEVYSEEDHLEIEKELKRDDLRQFVRQRMVIEQSVVKSVFSGAEFLQEPKRIPGKWIPVIPIYGYRAYVDGTERYKGVVRKLKDASRLFNMQISQLAENAASSGQETPYFDPDQMPEAHNAAWASRNNKTWLPVKALRDNDGKIVLSGPIGYSKPPMLDQSTQALMGIVPTYIQSVTGGVAQDTLDPKSSGKAINAMIKRANLNTQTIFDNVANAVEWNGTVWQGMAQEVLNSARTVRSQSRDGTDKQVQMEKPILDSDSGEFKNSNSLQDKKFKAYSDIGPQYDSMRQEVVEDLKGMAELAAKSPGGAKYLDAIFSLMIENTAGVGLTPLKELNRKNMLLQGLVKPETPEEKQFMAQAAQQNQQPQAQEQLMLSLAKEAEGNAVESLAEAKKTESETIENLSSAGKTRAETAQIISEIQNEKIKTLAEIRKQVFDTLAKIPIANNGG